MKNKMLKELWRKSITEAFKLLFEQKPTEINLNDVLRTGLAIIGQKHTGKTTFMKNLTRTILKTRKDINIRCFEDALEFAFDSDFRTWQLIQYGKPIRPLFNSIYCTTLLRGFATDLIRKFVIRDWKSQATKKIKQNGKLDEWILYIIDDAHSVIGRYALSREINKILLKWVGTGRNLNMSYALVSQRFQSLSTPALERVESYLIMRVKGARNKSKLRSIGIPKPIIKRIEKLKLGQAIHYHDGICEQISFKRFVPKQQPMRI